MKSLFALLLFILSSLFVEAQAYQNSWAKNTNPASNIESSMILDSVGNSYVFGSSGAQGYVSKYDPSGTRIWQSSVNNISLISSSVVDRQGNVYVTGSFYNTVYFASDTLAASGFSQMFIAKYDASGTPLWAKIGGATGESKGNYITLNATQDQLYVAGLKKKSSTFNNTVYPNDKDILVAKTSSDGQGAVLLKTYGHVGGDEALFVKVDQNENVFVGGYYTTYIGTNFETIDFDGTFIVAGDVEEPFVMKMTSSLIFAQFHQMNGKKYVDELLIDGSGNLFVHGHDGNDRHYITKFDNSFNTIWSVLGPLNDVNGVGEQRANSMVLNKEGNISWTGSYHLTSGNAALNTIGTYQLTDISSTFFLAQLNASTGEFLNLQTETTGYVFGKCIGEDGDGNIYVFAREMDFSNEHVGNLGRDNVNDGFFLSKYKKPTGNVYVKYYTNPYSFTEQAHGSSRFMGNSVWCGQFTASKTFVLKNTGNRVLDLGAPLGFSFTGTNPGDYRVDTSATNRLVNIGDSTTFTVIFDPLLPGNRTADLNILSSDYDENPYIINFYGTGVKQNQTISWSGSNYAANYGVTGVDVTLSGVTSNANGTITYSISDTTVAQIINGNVLHFLNAGSAIITATHSGDISYNSGTITKSVTVNKAALTITANDTTKYKDYANPVFRYTITGFKYNDDASAITGTPTLTTTATLNSATGTYPITVATTGMSSRNYTFPNKVNGTLTIVYAPTIVVRRSNNTNIGCSGTFDMGTVPVGDSVTMTIKILNNATVGTVLKMSSITCDMPSDYRLNTALTNMNVAYSLSTASTFTVTFAPKSVGSLPAHITILNNTPDKSSCVINLTGIGDFGTGTMEINQQNRIAIYPNPVASGEAIMVSSSENIEGIWLYDILGRSEFYSTTTFQTHLQGVLLVRILTTEGERWTKILVAD